MKNGKLPLTIWTLNFDLLSSSHLLPPCIVHYNLPHVLQLHAVCLPAPASDVDWREVEEKQSVNREILKSTQIPSSALSDFSCAQSSPTVSQWRFLHSGNSWSEVLSLLEQEASTSACLGVLSFGCNNAIMLCDLYLPPAWQLSEPTSRFISNANIPEFQQRK